MTMQRRTTQHRCKYQDHIYFKICTYKIQKHSEKKDKENGLSFNDLMVKTQPEVTISGPSGVN